MLERSLTIGRHKTVSHEQHDCLGASWQSSSRREVPPNVSRAKKSSIKGRKPIPTRLCAGDIQKLRHRFRFRHRGYLEWIAPIKVYPGEDELQSLAEGVFRVFSGEEPPRTLAPAQD